ncbi:hypothetical protein LPJ59_000080 [Coemansia sp. RSA 2399]|nr:hypothetical protein LPJ59_000080 [Coemansia sp. RSA 2399]KAJ1908456.1 hypothetical protein LPJ81_000072 [Coemansia sp. IMI 209127]
MPISTKSSLGAKPVSVPAGFNDFFTNPSRSAIPSLAQANDGEGQQAAANHTLAFRMFALAVATYLVKVTLGMIRYALDATLILLVVGSVVAVAMPGPKGGPVAQALAYAESVVDPLFALIADRGIDAVSAHVRTLAGYLGLAQARARR